MSHKSGRQFPERILHVLEVSGHILVWKDPTFSPGDHKQCLSAMSIKSHCTSQQRKLHKENLCPLITSPSQEPDSRVERLLVCLAIQFTPSLCPSNEATNGLANTRSSLVALRARVYSLFISNGCSVGS